MYYLNFVYFDTSPFILSQSVSDCNGNYKQRQHNTPVSDYCAKVILAEANGEHQRKCKEDDEINYLPVFNTILSKE